MSHVNDPALEAEILGLHHEYEAALVSNDVENLTRFFWDSPNALRFGDRESLYGADQIEAFRRARSAIGLEREVFNLRIVTFGEDCGIVTLEFRRQLDGRLHHGRQSQVWRKLPEGWRIVSAHVSYVRETYEEQAAYLIDLPLPLEQREAVAQNIEAARRIAAPLFAFPLPEEIESAARFEP
jgi:hypothetical protein